METLRAKAREEALEAAKQLEEVNSRFTAFFTQLTRPILRFPLCLCVQYWQATK